MKTFFCVTKIKINLIQLGKTAKKKKKQQKTNKNKTTTTKTTTKISQNLFKMK